MYVCAVKAGHVCVCVYVCVFVCVHACIYDYWESARLHCYIESPQGLSFTLCQCVHMRHTFACRHMSLHVCVYRCVFIAKNIYLCNVAAYVHAKHAHMGAWGGWISSSLICALVVCLVVMYCACLLHK
jgi:hypothetical protein